MRLDTRNKLLLGGFVLVLAISYHLAIKKTLVLRSGHLKATELREKAQDIPMELNALRQKELLLDAQFKDLDLGSSSPQNDLLRFLNGQSSIRSVKVIDFKSPHIAKEGPTTTKTFQFILEGGFQDILKVAHAVEVQGGFGGISHMVLEKQRDHRKRKSFLKASLHLQQIE